MKILVSVDGSESSKRTIDYVTSRPWADDDKFMIVCVTEPDKKDMSVADAAGAEDADFSSEAALLLNNFKSRLGEHLPEHQIESSVLAGPVVESLVDCATAYGADLIIIGSEGRTGVSRFILGSVAEDVLRSAPCSVHIVRRKLSP